VRREYARVMYVETWYAAWQWAYRQAVEKIEDLAKLLNEVDISERKHALYC
jgi:hypothetical protein